MKGSGVSEVSRELRWVARYVSGGAPGITFLSLSDELLLEAPAIARTTVRAYVGKPISQDYLMCCFRLTTVDVR